MKDFVNLNKLLTTALDLNRHVIGIKFISTQTEFEDIDAVEIEKPFRYCVLIKSATNGHAIKISKDYFKCNGSGVTFGYWDIPDDYYDSDNKSYLHSCGEVTSNVRQEMYIYDEESYGMLIKPLNKYVENEPDVIMIITSPYNAMRLSQGYTYNYGLKKDFNIAGNQAICLESTLVPLLDKDMNISMLCAGTRYAAGWSDDEVSVGISIEKIEGVVDGLINTINTVETNEKKKQIIERNGSEELDGIKITMNTAYFHSGTFQ